MKDVSNVAVSRAAMKRQKQHAAITNGSNTASLSTRSGRSAVGTSAGPAAFGGVENATTKKLLWAKVLASKLQAENTNIAKRMGKMEELEKAMTLLDKMRKAIVEDIYKAKVGSVFDAFPVFATFDAKVDIIDVNADDDAPVLSAATDDFSTPRSATATDDSSTPRASPVHVATNDEDADDDVSVEEP